ncbi:unnamed protein product [Rangifer tarandus platyrhynchus]|uniref:Uncharacterized protein n=2 Tax=Rangifer tarandus platyrhynchus TaxID=3082113 RepID=A0ACB0E1X8_RANTA|nr:unnamed protein product [Rangifer tarandus platyrhynchus]CAI9694419.1 unnamed protein product [Rangifer tarandus platyrhynchus]
MAAGLEAAAEQEGWRPDGLASGRGAGGAAGAVTAPCARRPSPQETGAPRPRPGRVLVLRSRHAAPAAASAPHHRRGLRERGLRGGRRPPLGHAGPARETSRLGRRRLSVPGGRLGRRSSAGRVGATRSARSARTPSFLS